MHLTRLLLLLMALGGLAGCSRKPPDPLLVGHVAPFSGPDRFIGEHARRGMELALKDINEEPIGQRAVAVLHADSRGDPERARSEAVRLLKVNRVLALLGGHQEAAQKMAMTVPSYSVPFLTPAALAATAAYENTFSLDVAPAFRGEALARFADEVLRADRAVLVVDNNQPVSAAIASAFERRWLKGGKNRLQTWSYDPKTEGGRLSARLRDSQAQVLVFAGAAKDFEPLRASLGAGDRAPALLFAGASEEWARLLADEKAARGVYGATIYSPKHFTEEGKKFVTRYTELYNERPDLFAFQGYEQVKVIATALRDTKGAGGAKLREELAKDRTFDALTGKLSFKGGHAVRPLYLLRTGEEARAKEYRQEEK